ncbi:unnamed protein product [Acanthoscelides obtectus]|uniref:Uncharacterized protein n=1 Tax=Acanthoscelides obtectus TaxID=200917 RepID=A0A9P0KYY3_ACAOB|nr:unnamed protein product [Acanthoscelides obtectus]CAK1666426.1 hypothetical protein AOBTE_LOCUS25322 [Acanthoscelides obtectus]
MILLFIAILMIQCLVAVHSQSLLSLPLNLENVANKNSTAKTVDKHPIIQLDLTNNNSKRQDKNVNITQSPNESLNKNTLSEDRVHSEDLEESSVLNKFVIVIVALTIVFFIFLAVRTFRASRNSIVKKYGVKARRCDVEMEPLPLDDEEDETIFELGNFARH